MAVLLPLLLLFSKVIMGFYVPFVSHVHYRQEIRKNGYSSPSKSLQWLHNMEMSTNQPEIEKMFQRSLLRKISDKGDIDKLQLHSKRNATTFDRTNRVDGRKKWVEEINKKKLEKSLSNNEVKASELVSLAKVLLYSGIPEQVLELYSAYYKVISQPNHSNDITTAVSVIPVIPDTKLILTTIRAFIAVDDVQGALKLLQAVSRAGLQFDAVEKSLLLVDLASASAEGFQAALQLRISMEQMEERISSNAYASLLKGIRLYALQSSLENTRLLVHPSKLQEALQCEPNMFHMSPEVATQLATEITDSYIASLHATGPVKRSPKVLGELVRVVFRAAVMEVKTYIDRNFAVDKARTERSQAQDGIGSILELMKKYDIRWDIHIADVIMDECLRVGDLTGVSFVSETMWNKKIWARSSTFNALLHRYAESGDGENAFRLVQDVMEKNELTRPNTMSYKLLLRACAKTERGRFYSAQVITSLMESGRMNKDAWDRLLELCVLSRKRYDSVLLEMVSAGVQPDEHSIMIILSALRTVGDLNGALTLYTRQCCAIERVAKLSQSPECLLRWDELMVDGEFRGTEADLDLQLPPPTRRTVHCILEMLRDAGRGETAVKLLGDMISRSELFSHSVSAEERMSGDESDSERSSAVTMESLRPVLSGADMLGAQVAPDLTTFALVIEACVNAGEAALALKAFAEMEKLGVSADRRIYSAIVNVFGLRGDVPSALGVFQEMRRSGIVADVSCLQSVLDVCLKRRDPFEFVQVSTMLTTMAAEGADLEVYSRDLLMQCFPDARSLGAALTAMESVPLVSMSSDLTLGGGNGYEVSLDVISVLAQACRTAEGPEALGETLLLLGSMGIRPDRETMEYFRLPDEPSANSPNSRHYRRRLVPHKARVRSLLDIEVPTLLRNDVGLPERGFQVQEDAPGGRIDSEPYFESGSDRWTAHVKALKAAMRGVDEKNVGENGMSGLHMTQRFENKKRTSNETKDKKRVSPESRTTPQSRTLRSITAQKEIFMGLSGVQAFNVRNQYDRPKKKKADKLRTAKTVRPNKKDVKVSGTSGPKS